MGTAPFRRPVRPPAPVAPTGEVHLEAPPEVPRVVPTSPVMRLLPLVMVLASVGFVVVMGVSNPTSWLFGGMVALSSLGMAAGGLGRGGTRRAEADADRTDYLRYLAGVRRRVRETAVEQRRALEWNHPDPPALAALARGSRMWERRPGDTDFAHVRVGRGSQRLATALVAPQTGPVDDLEPVSSSALRRFVRTHSVVADLPTAVSLRAFAVVGLTGPDGPRAALARALVAQIATFHGPDDLMLAVAAGDAARSRWEWVKWLPHVAHPRLRDGAGALRMVAPSLAGVEHWLGPELAGRARFARGGSPPPGSAHVVVVLDGAQVDLTESLVLSEGLAGVTVLDLTGDLEGLAERRGLVLEIDPGAAGSAPRLGARGPAGTEWFGRPDALGPAEAEALARRLAPFRPPPAGGASSDDTAPGLLELLGVEGEPDGFDVAAAWRPRPPRHRLRVPLGTTDDGAPVELDIKESAQEGMGPHGLCVGATGSGKSELLRTVVLGLATTHSPAALNLVLVDFKGGATFAGLAPLPHVAAVITNLADDIGLVDRMHDALAGEMTRRQELLREAGNLASVAEYERLRETGADLAALPTLFVVVDEFSELLHQKPDLAELFVAIGRLGRSLRIHLLLASQRLEEGRLRGLDSHLSYRIGLKTFSASDSRAVLGVPDAHELPSVPGAGFLRSETAAMVRFSAGYVSGPLRPAVEGRGDAPAGPRDRRPRPFRAAWVEPPREVLGAGPPDGRDGNGDDGVDERGAAGPSVLDAVVERLRGHGPPAHEVWLPPLDEPPTLDALLPPLVASGPRGLCAPGFPANGTLTLPVGLVDRPFDQRRDVLVAELAGGAGHVAVVGGPRSGRSTMLRTLVLSAALTHTPAEVAVYGVDLGGGTLAALSGLPHVAAVAGRGEPDLVRRTVAEVRGILTERERRFAEAGLESMADLRARRRRGEALPAAAEALSPPGDVLLVVDGWGAFRTEHEGLEPAVLALASGGLGYGVHVVVAATRWAELRPALKDTLGTRFELRLGDPSESEVDRRVAATVPSGRPGRGLSPEKLHVLGALPRADGRRTTEGLGSATADLVERVAAAWTGTTAPPVRLLPARLGLDALPGPTEGPAHHVPIGLDEDGLAPVLLDTDADPHLLCFADAESGKTALLRLLAHQVVARFPPDRARLVVVDHRRGLLGAVESEHLIAHTSAATTSAAAVDELVASLRRRLPGAEVTPAQLRARSWWSGPEVFVLVDDYDLVATTSGNPLTPLLELLPQAKDVGLHLVVARRSGGAGRALFDPVLARLRELATPTLVMNGSRDEGPLAGGVRPGPQPPGRGWLVGRRPPERLVQLAWRPPDPPIRPDPATRPAGAGPGDAGGEGA